MNSVPAVGPALSFRMVRARREGSNDIHPTNPARSRGLTPRPRPRFDTPTLREPSSSKLSAFLPLVALAAGIAVLATFNAAYPIRQWLLVRVVGYWALALYWGAGCFALGLELVRRVAPRQYRCSEVPFVAFPMGVLAFGILVFVVGVLGLLQLPFFVLGPLAFVGAGSSALREWVRHVRSRRPLRGWVPSPVERLALVFGACCVVAVYLPILTPHNMQHDARWYHLPIAEQYVAEGAIRPFREGWFLGTYPHLASLLYVWAFLLPAGIVHRVELAAHMEFVIFLMTIASIPALVRRIVPGTRLPFAWAGFFLFPAIFVYDSNLSLGADHVAALFAPAGMLALFAALATLSPRHAALVGAAAAGTVLTKYSAACVTVPLLGAVVVRAAVAVRAGKAVRRAVESVGAMALSFVVLWAPHWLKNAIWYGDPFYPLFGDSFPAHPWDARASNALRVFMNWGMIRPKEDLSGLLDTLRGGLTVGFRVPDGWHQGVPVFGFLFAATLFCVPFSRPGPRLKLSYALGVAASLVWYWTNHHERYLQACVPWFAAATVAWIVVAWTQHGTRGRVSVAALVGVQLLCGAGVFLLPSYFMIASEHPLIDVMKLVRQGYDKQYAARFEPFDDWEFASWTALGKLLPKHARVLAHEDRLWLGLDAPVVVDEAQWQAGIRYSGLSSTADVYDVIHRFGVTHIVTGTSPGDSGDHGITGNLLFWDFVTTDTRSVARRGGLSLWEMPAHRPSVRSAGTALVATCNLSVPSGLYDVTSVGKGPPLVALPPKGRVPLALTRRATFLVLEDDCGYSVDPSVAERFRIMGIRGKVFFEKRASDPGDSPPATAAP